MVSSKNCVQRLTFVVIIEHKYIVDMYFVGWAAKCVSNMPTVEQTQVGFGQPPKFAVTVRNRCPMCPAIDIHVKRSGFPQSLASPRVFRVAAAGRRLRGECWAAAGAPSERLLQLHSPEVSDVPKILALSM